MKFFLVVSFLMSTPSALERPLYVFKKPSFETMSQCKEYVSVMYLKIYKEASKSYNFKHTPEAIYCITKDAVKDIFEYNYGNKNKTGV